MTARLSLTQAQIARAMRAAKAEGLVPVMTPIGLAFVESSQVALPSQDQPRVNSCDEAFGGQS
jgi:hypothetical protein